MAIDMSSNGIKLRRFAFLSGYGARNEAEEKEVHELDEYFHSINDHPGWPISNRTLKENDV